MQKTILLKLLLLDPDTTWISDAVFEALEDDEEILIRETTIKDAHDNFYEVSVYLKLQAYHQLDWIERLVVDQLNPGEVLLHSEYK